MKNITDQNKGWLPTNKCDEIKIALELFNYYRQESSLYP